MAIQRIAETTPRRKNLDNKVPIAADRSAQDVLRAVAKTHRDGLKIRRRRLHGGSIPPPGTNYLLYLQKFTVHHRVQGRPSRFHTVQIRYSAYPAYFQYVEDSWQSACDRTLYIDNFVYARLRNARRISRARSSSRTNVSSLRTR
jgi:hypothetical protein